MFKHAWTVICREAVINADSNAISILDVFEGLEIEATDTQTNKPVDISAGVNLPIAYEIVSYLFREDDQKKETMILHIELDDPKGNNVIKLKQDVTFEPGMMEMRNRLHINGLGVKGFGKHTFNVFIEEAKVAKKKVATIPFKLTQKNKT